MTATYQEPPADGNCTWEICSLCRGHGHVVNPSIDASGLTAEDFTEDPDFADDYRSGAYDVECRQCRGRGSVAVLPRSASNDEDDGYPPACSDPGGHSWVENDETGATYCEFCLADGDA